MKWFALLAFLLFLGVAVAPSINANISQIFNNEDLIELTIETHGYNNIEQHTVKLTKQELDKLDSIFTLHQSQLSYAKTIDETKQIYMETLNELNTLGLLPKDLSIDEAEKLVFGGYSNSRFSRLIEKYQQIDNPKQNEIDNQFCLLSGYSNLTFITHLFLFLMGGQPLVLIGETIAFFIVFCFFSLLIPGVVLGLMLLIPIAILIELYLLGFSLFPFCSFNQIFVGRGEHEAAYGWCSTSGIMGDQHINGSFFGNMSYPLIEGLEGPWHMAAQGFLGFKILRKYKLNNEMQTYYYIGNAANVQMRKQTPFP